MQYQIDRVALNGTESVGGQISAPRNAFQREAAQKLIPNFEYQVRLGKSQFPSVWRGIPEIVLISL